MKTIPCPQPGDHGTECICNGARELIVRPKTALCETCGDPAAQRNLGFIANVEGRIVGTPCTDCGTVGDVAEFARRKAAADAAAGPDVVPERSEFVRAVGSDKRIAPPPIKTVDDAIPADHRTSDDDALLGTLREHGLFTAEAARSTLLTAAADREQLHQRMRTASADERYAIIDQYDDLDRAERIAKRILAELG